MRWAFLLVVASGCIRAVSMDGVDPEADCALLMPGPGPEPFAAPQWDVESRKFFDDTTVGEMHITFFDWSKFEAIWRDPRWRNDPEAWELAKGAAYVHCSVTVAGTTFEDAACRPRGSPEGWYKEKKPQIKVKFNKWDSSRRFYGLRSILLEFNRYGGVPIRDWFAMKLVRAAGLPGARVRHFKVFINGLDRGIYQVIEPIDREFLEAWFANPDGNLYEGGYIKETNEEDPDNCDVTAVNDLLALERLGIDHTSFVASFSRIVDVTQNLRVMAVEAVFPTVDNFVNGSTNFYWYHHPGQGFVAIPWDLDAVLGDEQDILAFTGAEDSRSKLLNLVYEIPKWRRQFEDALVEIRDGPFLALHKEIDRGCNLLRPLVLADEAYLADYKPWEYDEDCAEMHRLLDLRVAVLRQALGR